MNFALRLVSICFLIMLLVGVVGAVVDDPRMIECKESAWKKYKSAQTDYYPPFVENVASNDRGAQCSFKTIGYSKAIYNFQRDAAESWASNTYGSEIYACDADYYEHELNKLSRWGYFLEWIGWNKEYYNMITFYKGESNERLRVRSEEATRFAQEIATATGAYNKAWNACMGLPI